MLGVGNVLLKGCLGVSVMIWVRWTLPRLRIDQVMTTCLKYCTPIAAIMLLGATVWNFWLPHRNFFGVLASPAETYALTEGWPVAAGDSAAKVKAGEAATPSGAADSQPDAEAAVPRGSSSPPSSHPLDVKLAGASQRRSR